MVRRIPTILAVWMLCLIGAADPPGSAPVGRNPANSAQVQAATRDAVNRLLAQIAQQPIGTAAGSLTVGEFLEQTDHKDLLIATLERSEQIGGPRWIDPHTTQVQLQISGTRVVAALSQIAASYPDRSPIPAALLQRRLQDWRDRTFVATGSSTGAVAAENLSPPVLPPSWVSVPRPQRRQAIIAAKKDAARRVLSSIAPLSLPGTSTTIGAAVASPDGGLARELSNYITSRPIMAVEFRDDLTVSVQVWLTPQDLLEAIKTYAKQLQVVPSTLPDSAWDALGPAMAEHVGAAIGVGRPPNAPAPPQAPLPVWTQVPDWVDHQADAAGTADNAGSKLLTARAAELNARANLASQIGSLTLPDGTTLAAAQARYPAIAQAVKNALGRARLYKSDYASDGSVTVRVSLDLQQLWDALRSAAP